MTCPICEGATKVTNSRPGPDIIRRRRECVGCGYRFTTIEMDEDMHKRERIRLCRALEPKRFSVEYNPITDEARIVEEAEK